MYTVIYIILFETEMGNTKINRVLEKCIFCKPPASMLSVADNFTILMLKRTIYLLNILNYTSVSFLLTK